MAKKEELYVVKTYQKVVDGANAMLADANEKIVKKAVENSKEFAADVKKNTTEVFEGVVADSKKVAALIPKIETIAPKVVEGADEDADYYLAVTAKKVRETATATFKEYNDAVKKTYESRDELVKKAIAGSKELPDAWVKKAIENTKEFKEDVEKTAKEAIEGVTADTKLVAGKITGMITEKRAKATEKVQDTVKSGLGSITAAMDLPTREDIQKLTSAMEVFNKKADALMQ